MRLRRGYPSTPTLRVAATDRDGASRCLRVRLTQTLDGIDDAAPGLDTQLRFERNGATLEVSDLFDPVTDNPSRVAGAVLNLRVEVRSDNGPQFAARLVKEYFVENHLDQVFTHPYTPQENGHIESFHALLATFLQRHTFWCFEELLAGPARPQGRVA